MYTTHNVSVQKQRQSLKFPGGLQFFSTLPYYSENATFVWPLLTGSRETAIPLCSQLGYYRQLLQ